MIRSKAQIMKSLISDKVHPSLIQTLKQLGPVDYKPAISPSEVQQIISEYQGLVINSKIQVDESFLAQAPHLRWIGRLGSGMDMVDLEACQRHEVKFYRSPEGNCQAVGQHVLGMLLCLMRNIIGAHQMVQSLERWNRESLRGIELDGQKVGIYGFGFTGQALAKALKGFDVELLVYDLYASVLPQIHPQQRRVERDEIISAADVLSLHIPLTDLTRGMVDAEFMHAMKVGAILINTSRGPILSLQALTEALASKHLYGACLDVFENEKMETLDPDQHQTFFELIQQKNLVLSPHIAGWTSLSLKRIADVLGNKVLNDWNI